MPHVTFAERIRQARLEAGLDVPELARRADVSDRAVYLWEKGQRTPRAELLRRLARATEKPVAWFYLEEEPV